jgi:hypothetical protein
MPARLPENFRPIGIRPWSQPPARTKRSPSASRRQAAKPSATARSATSSNSTGAVATTTPRRRAVSRSVVSSPTPLMAQISRLGSASITAVGSPAMPWLTTPRIRSAIGPSAAALSGASQTSCSTNSRLSASSTNGRWFPIAAISTFAMRAASPLVALADRTRPRTSPRTSAPGIRSRAAASRNSRVSAAVAGPAHFRAAPHARRPCAWTARQRSSRAPAPASARAWPWPWPPPAPRSR